MPATIDTLSAKRVLATRGAPARHWVGDGFPVHGLFGYSGEGVAARSPFLLLDYAAPTEFSPTTQRRGVGSHPHRGFETVTIVYDGEVEHRDSTGAGGVIRRGDVQWMTAGGGIVHEEFHSADYAARGGAFEMVQLWVTLPARDKMAAPGYQGITADRIPVVALPGDAGTARIIAGRHGDAVGPARSFTPMNVWDVHLKASHQVAFDLPEGHTTALFLTSGAIRIGGQQARATDLAVMERVGIIEAVVIIVSWCVFTCLPVYLFTS